MGATLGFGPAIDQLVVEKRFGFNAKKEDQTMPNLFSLLLVALFVYLIFFRKGGIGMGCCGGHGSERLKESDPSRPSHQASGEIIDLAEDQYTVLAVEEERPKEIGRTRR